MTRKVFERALPVVDFPAEEERIRSFWEEHGIVEKALGARQGAPRFIFYEGPPTANGTPHNGHVLTRVMKDVIPRYRAMRGFEVPRRAGWDTHGLPVEIEVEKELRISGKDAIVEYGVEPFIRRCLDSVLRYTGEWKRLTEKLAFWLDFDEAYVTYHEEYVESVWWAISELFKRGLLYRGHKVVWWWAQGGTVLSAAEVGEGYRTVEDPSLYVRLPLLEKPGTALLAWTTTPWTLPSNALAAVKPDVPYAVVRDGEDRLIVAEALVAHLEAKVGRELPVEETLRGQELVGQRYAPPFDWFSREGEPDLWRVVPGDFVELDAGTGIVHIAPAFGEVDFEVLQKERLANPDLPLLCAVRPDGTFDPAIADSAYAGRWVKEADRDLVREIKERGLSWHIEQIRHEYPYCVRSENDPLIQYARPAWYIRTTDHVDEALANNAAIRWLPEHIRDGRFGDFLRNNVDWALSRERFWGTPLSIWVNDVTGEMDAPASVSEILERNPQAFDAFEAERQKDPSLSPNLRVHKPWIDQVTWEKDGEPGVYRRVPEVIDAWFDSGCMPFAQWGYPHKNRENFEASFPADFISEAIDQTRGWFNTLLWVSTLLFPEREAPHPYKSCIVLGHVADRAGKKESKSKGNYTPPEIILDRVRLEFAVVSPDVDPPPEGIAWIAREDYEGLDLRGESTDLALYRNDAESGEPRTLEIRPTDMPRRIVHLSAADLQALDLEPVPPSRSILPREVPGLPDPNKVWLEDPHSTAPGADAFRWFFYASNPPWNPTRHSLSGVRTTQRELPLKLRSVYAFFTIYAEIDGFDPADAACKERRRAPAERSLLDRWILSELAMATRDIARDMDNFLVYDAACRLTQLTEGLSNWWVRRSRDRFWAPGMSDEKLDAHWTLYECLLNLSPLVAPFLPYLAEEMWQNLARAPFGDGMAQSVHLADFPEPDLASIDEELAGVIATVRELVSLGLQVRTANRLRVRQPLAAAEIVLADPSRASALKEHLALIGEELNVAQVRFVEDADAYVSYQVRPNFRALGPRVGKNMPKLKKALAEADAAALRRELETGGSILLRLGEEEIAIQADEISIGLEAHEGYAAASGEAGVVVLHTELTPGLIEEGRFREVLHRVQNFRKELDLAYVDRIELTLDGSPALLDAVRPRVEELKGEVLATRIVVGSTAEEGAHAVEATVDGETLALGLKVVS